MQENCPKASFAALSVSAEMFHPAKYSYSLYFQVVITWEHWANFIISWLFFHYAFTHSSLYLLKFHCREKPTAHTSYFWFAEVSGHPLRKFRDSNNNNLSSSQRADSMWLRSSEKESSSVFVPGYCRLLNLYWSPVPEQRQVLLSSILQARTWCCASLICRFAVSSSDNRYLFLFNFTAASSYFVELFSYDTFC